MCVCFHLSIGNKHVLSCVCVNVPLDRGKVLRLTAQRLSFRDTLVRERQLPRVHLKVRVKLDRADELAGQEDIMRCTQH